MIPSRIRELLLAKPGGAVSIYLTAGFPKRDDTVPLVCELASLGIDFIEIGIPFSDPVADGPTIQGSSEQALKNGMSLELVFKQVSEIRKYSTVPIVLMGYLNSVMQYGIEKFCNDSKARGVDGVILPDLPIELFIEEYKPVFDRCDLHAIFLVTPQSADERIRLIDQYSTAFIYAVSSAAVTGGSLDLSNEKRAYLNRLKSMKLNAPLVVGFGLSSRSDLLEIAEFAHGGIIGSAFIRVISSATDPVKAARDFAEEILGKE